MAPVTYLKEKQLQVLWALMVVFVTVGVLHLVADIFAVMRRRQADVELVTLMSRVGAVEAQLKTTPRHVLRAVARLDRHVRQQAPKLDPKDGWRADVTQRLERIEAHCTEGK